MNCVSSFPVRSEIDISFDFNKNVLNLLLITEGEKKHYVLISNDPQKKKETKEIAKLKGVRAV